MKKDELLRQIIIEDEELGKIIYRIRNEFQTLIFTYKYMVERDPVSHLDPDSMVIKLVYGL